jgi:hypothetical protein
MNFPVLFSVGFPVMLIMVLVLGVIFSKKYNAREGYDSDPLDCEDQIKETLG